MLGYIGPMFAAPAHAPALKRWLLAVMALVVLMVALGGYTRLTESGLSIVEWNLVGGTLPPMSDAAWEAEFAKYQSSPQFRQVNSDFGVAEFKTIFWLEYLHRLLGRIIGLMVIVPLLVFWARGMLTPQMKRWGIGLTVLVAAQGAVGWIMVASGLVDEPRVAPVKLALHLSLAFVFFLALLTTYWKVDGKRAAWNLGGAALCDIVALQIIFGALVAGLDAGLTYNTYPLMDGQFIPDGLHVATPWWLNHLENVLTVQFQHRMGAIAVVVASLALVAYRWRGATGAEKQALRLLLGVVAVQFVLGVATLLTHVHIHLAVAHQLAALLLLGVAWRITYGFAKP